VRPLGRTSFLLSQFFSNFIKAVMKWMSMKRIDFALTLSCFNAICFNDILTQKMLEISARHVIRSAK